MAGGDGFVDISSPGAHVPATLEGLFETDARVVRCSVGSAAENTLPLPPPQLESLPRPIAKGFRFKTLLPSPAVYLLRDAVAFYRMGVSLDGRIVTGSDYAPEFYRELMPKMLAPLARQRDRRPTQRIREPVYVPWLWKYHEYGHFLTEMLPRLLLVKDLYARGLKFPVLVPTEPDYLQEAVITFAPELVVLAVDGHGVEFELDHCLIPVDGSVNHVFHPETGIRINAAVNALRSNSGPPPDDTRQKKNVFMSRMKFRASKGKDFRLLANEGELQDIARNLGLEIVEPQELSIRDQVLLLSQSGLVVGEASSALHNTIFASGARVISLGWANPVQTMIAALQSHRLSYLLPDRMFFFGDYESIPFSEMSDDRRFTIDPKTFESTLEAELSHA